MAQLDPPHRVEPSSREIQVVFGGEYIASTNAPLLVWDRADTRPQYYVPKNSLLLRNPQIKFNLIVDAATNTHANPTHEGDGDAGAVEFFELTVGGKSTVVTTFKVGILEGYVRLEFADMG